MEDNCRQEASISPEWEEALRQQMAAEEAVRQHLADSLAPLQAGSFRIGYGYEVNGPGAEKHAAEVTTWEIEQLCKIWAERRRSILFDYKAYGQSGSYGIRVEPFAQQRLGYFAGLIGEDKVEEIVAGVFASFEAEAEEARPNVVTPF